MRLVGFWWVTPGRVMITPWRHGPRPRVARRVRRGQLLRRQCEAEMSAPRSVDVEVAAEHTLLAESELTEHPQAGGVLGPHRGLEPVEPDGPEAVVGDGRDGRGDDPAAGDAGVDPVAHVRRQQWFPDDVA